MWLFLTLEQVVQNKITLIYNCQKTGKFAYKSLITTCQEIITLFYYRCVLYPWFDLETLDGLSCNGNVISICCDIIFTFKVVSEFQNLYSIANYC